MFLAVRGIKSLGDDFKLPTCGMFFNIFHPYDPVAYRIESLVDAEHAELRPFLVPHHVSDNHHDKLSEQSCFYSDGEEEDAPGAEGDHEQGGE